MMQTAVHQRACYKLHFTHLHTAPAALSARPQQHYPRRNSVVTRAQLGGMLDTLVTWGAVAASVGATVYAVFYDWQRDTKQQTRQKQQGGVQPGLEDNFTWAVMGGVSFIPLFNYMAWVLGALQSDNPRLYYWAAALYALPLLRNGLDQDWFSVTLLLLGAVHVQALRVGATEPELQAKLQQQLKPLAVVKTLANAAGAAAGAALGSGSNNSTAGSTSGRGQLGEGSMRKVGDVLQQDESSYEEEEAVRQQQELEEFDRRLDASMKRGQDS